MQWGEGLKWEQGAESPPPPRGPLTLTTALWICSFLVNRQQCVKFSEYISDWLFLKGGMPQGSYLGPLIFLISINDLTAGCLLHKFMDDIKLSEITLKGGLQQYANYIV